MEARNGPHQPAPRDLETDSPSPRSQATGQLRRGVVRSCEGRRGRRRDYSIRNGISTHIFSNANSFGHMPAVDREHSGRRRPGQPTLRNGILGGRFRDVRGARPAKTWPRETCPLRRLSLAWRSLSMNQPNNPLFLTIQQTRAFVRLLGASRNFRFWDERPLVRRMTLAV